MEALAVNISHASSHSSIPTAACCAAADAETWADEDGFIIQVCARGWGRDPTRCRKKHGPVCWTTGRLSCLVCCWCVQEDDSVLPASARHSEADSDDVLEAFIQAELAKFQQQQAQKYATLLSEGQAYAPLPSPAPGQQLLRAQQKLQEALSGAILHPLLNTDCYATDAFTMQCCGTVLEHPLPAATVLI